MLVAVKLAVPKRLTNLVEPMKPTEPAESVNKGLKVAELEGLEMATPANFGFNCFLDLQA